MKFANPEALKLLILIPLLVAFFLWFNRSASKRLQRFAIPSLLKRLITGANGARRAGKFILFLLALTALIVSLARPQLGVEPREIKRVGVDIMIVLDTSLSMAAEDIAPSRLAKAKKEVVRLADAFEGNRLGLLLFAGESAVECPLTRDVSTFKLFLNSINFNSIPVGGTDISGALRKALASFSGSRSKSKVIVLLTDGEDNEGNPVKVAKEAAEKGIKIFTIGLGRKKGVPIPIRDEKGRLLGYKKDREGETVLTSQNANVLEEIALITNALFVSSQGGLFDIEPVIETIQSLEKSDITSTRFTLYTDRFTWLLALALMLLFIEFLV